MNLYIFVQSYRCIHIHEFNDQNVHQYAIKIVLNCLQRLDKILERLDAQDNMLAQCLQKDQVTTASPMTEVRTNSG